jgi:hypothetical protein
MSLDHFIDTNSIINKDYFNSVKELLTCSICTGIILDAKQCQTCENPFCNKCITKWQLKSKSCPYKCSPLIIKDCTRAIRNLLDKLILICPYECDSIQYTYDQLFKHIRSCKKVKCKCPTCGSIVAEGDMKDTELVKLKENIKLLQEDNKKLTSERNDLNEKIKQISKKINSSGSSTESELGLKDKCEHFKGNYIPLFACCNKAYPCYICHDLESRDHVYEFSNRVICLNCNNIYTGIQCSQCNTFQVYRKK